MNVGYGASCKRHSRAGEEEDCNKDPSAALGMTVLGERIDSQGRCATFLEDGILVSHLPLEGKMPRRGG